MKKILFLSIILSLTVISHTFAAPALKVTASGTTITATLSGVTDTDIYKIVSQTTPFADDTYKGSVGPGTPLTDPTEKQSTTATTKKPDALTWTTTGNIQNTTYYVRIVRIPSNAVYKPSYATSAASVQTGAENIAFEPLTTTLVGNDIVVSGKIKTDQIPHFKGSDYSASLVYTGTIPPEGATSLTDTFGPLPSRMTKSATGTEGINDDGTYYWHLTNLHPSTVYYFQQTVKYKYGNQNAKVDVINHVNSSVGTTIAAGSAAEQNDLNARSYTLLSKGFPGFSVMPDPDLCAQERAAGQAPKFCDINDVLNYFLKLLIGISGVFLVFRLMVEGYKYMTTDVPWLKVSAKSGFLTALSGLLLAMTSYIILNTINPKLVNENINVSQLNIVINLPDAGDGTVDQTFIKTGKGTYSTDASVSPAVTTAVSKIKNGWTLSSFHMSTNDKMIISLTKDGQTDNTNVITVSNGVNGFAQTGQGVTGDKKTPLGNWKILEIRQAPSGGAVFSKTGSNMGAAFFLLSPMTNGERGIGMHGNKNGTLGSTFGCIRLKNADILALLPYVKVGTPVIITN